jgi:hypothetical protein
MGAAPERVLRVECDRFGPLTGELRNGDAGVLRGRQVRTIGSPPTIAVIRDLAHRVLLPGA